MQQCPNCEKQISRAAATKCPHCGMPLGHTPPLSDESEEGNRTMQKRGVKELFKTGLVVGLMAWVCFVLLLAFSGVRESARRSACVNNLKQLGLVLNIYANENGGRFPPMDDTRNNFMFESDLLYPEYLTDVSILACPSDPETNPNKNFRLFSDHPDGTPAGEVHPDCITNMSYSYIGWMVMTDKETEAFFDAYDPMSPENHDRDLIVPEGSGNAESDEIHRLSQEVDRFLITCPYTLIQDQSGASTVPIMWDQISTGISKFNHIPAGQNVLYLDGHVDFHRYDPNATQFPVSPVSAAYFGGRPREPIPDCEE